MYPRSSLLVLSSCGYEQAATSSFRNSRTQIGARLRKGRHQSPSGPMISSEAGGSPLGVVRKSLPVDHNAWLVSDDPCVMPGRHDCEVPWAVLNLLAVVHDHLHPTGDEVARVGGLATVGLGDRLYMLRPSPTRQERGAADDTAFQVHQAEFAGAPLERAGFFG